MRSDLPVGKKGLKAAYFVCGSLSAAVIALIAHNLIMFDGDDQYALFLSLLARLPERTLRSPYSRPFVNRSIL